MAERIDVLLKLYDDHTSQARQHEAQRERMTNLVLIVSGALIVFVSQAKFAMYSLPAAITLMLVGFYGLLFARKHYERNQLHVSTVRQLRDEIDRELGVIPSDPEAHQKRSLAEIRHSGDEKHYATFPSPPSKLQLNAKSLIARLRLYYFWEGMHVVVILLGLILLCIILLHACGAIQISELAAKPQG